MAIGREMVENILKLTKTKWRTSITKVEPNRIVTRGFAQEDLINNISYPEMVYLLLKGELPSKKHSRMLESVLVSFCDHGVTPPSTQIARLMASAGSPMNVCVSGGLMAFGKYHAGAIENAMRIFQEGVQNSNGNTKKAGKKIVAQLENGSRIPGYGHRYHNEDPRPPKLIELARKYDCFSIHTELALNIERILSEHKGVRLNIDGANAAILSDMGFDWEIGSGIFMMGRLPGIIAHISEEKTREHPFRKIFNIDEIIYDGLD